MGTLAILLRFITGLECVLHVKEEARRGQYSPHKTRVHTAGYVIYEKIENHTYEVEL